LPLSSPDIDEAFEMVNNYGTSGSGYEIDVEPMNDITATEDSSLLGVSSVGNLKRELTAEGHATIVSSVGNLSNTIIGSGEYPLCVSFSLLTFPGQVC
jgi:hypothetical protein